MSSPLRPQKSHDTITFVGAVLRSLRFRLLRVAAKLLVEKRVVLNSPLLFATVRQGNYVFSAGLPGSKCRRAQILTKRHSRDAPLPASPSQFPTGQEAAPSRRR